MQAPRPTFGKLAALSSVEDFDMQLRRLSNLVWAIHYGSYPGGRDTRGRTLQEDEDEYLLPPGNELRLKQLRGYAAQENARGDGAALRQTLNEAQPLLAMEDFRASVLLTYAGALRAADAQRAAWVVYAGRVPPEARAPGQAHIDAATNEYVHAVERALRSGRREELAGSEQTQFLLGALLAAYNKERGDLAAGLSDQDREQGKLAAPFVRQTPCAQPTPRTSGKPSPSYGQILHGPADYYPVTSRRMGFEGSVLVRLSISETGCLERAEVWRSSGIPELDQAALQFAEQGVTYLPAEKDGKPVGSSTTLPVKFNLQ
jgi:TonB family protein